MDSLRVFPAPVPELSGGELMMLAGAFLLIGTIAMVVAITLAKGYTAPPPV